MAKHIYARSLLSVVIAAALQIPAVQADDNTIQDSQTAENPQQKPLAISDKKSSAENTLVVTAREQTLQAPGVSTIDSEAIKKHPIQRDVAEIIRTQPGVNLTGNSNSGQRGNNRQIDIRGMGPENTLILIDGMPVSSRNSVRYGWSDERDTRGDTNWVPPEMIDRIEVIRGPAAALYGNGAMGVWSISSPNPPLTNGMAISIPTSMRRNTKMKAPQSAITPA